MNERIRAHLDYARDWLDEAEKDFAAGNLVEGELNLSLAQAEIKRAWEESRLERKVIRMPFREADSQKKERKLSVPDSPGEKRGDFWKSTWLKAVSVAAIFLVLLVSGLNFNTGVEHEQPVFNVNPTLSIQDLERYYGGTEFSLMDSTGEVVVAREVHKNENSLRLSVSTAFAETP